MLGPFSVYFLCFSPPGPPLPLQPSPLSPGPVMSRWERDRRLPASSCPSLHPLCVKPEPPRPSPFLSSSSPSVRSRAGRSVPAQRPPARGHRRGCLAKGCRMRGCPGAGGAEGESPGSGGGRLRGCVPQLLGERMPSKLGAGRARGGAEESPGRGGHGEIPLGNPTGLGSQRLLCPPQRFAALGASARPGAFVLPRGHLLFPGARRRGAVGGRIPRPCIPGLKASAGQELFSVVTFVPFLLCELFPSLAESPLAFPSAKLMTVVESSEGSHRRWRVGNRSGTALRSGGAAGHCRARAGASPDRSVPRFPPVQRGGGAEPQLR